MVSDIRYAFRQLTKNPGFTIVALLTLALGIGVNAAIFSVVNAVLLRPLPYPDPDQIVSISEGELLKRLRESPSDPLSWQSQVASFAAAAGYQPGEVNLAGRGDPERLHVAQVTADFFRVMGVHPLLGRDFSPGEWVTHHEIVLSWGLWQRRYGGQSDIVGTTVAINGQPATVIGVMPGGFEFPAQAAAWVAPGLGGDTIHRGVRLYILLARLRQGVSLTQAQAEMTAIGERLRRDSTIEKGPVPDIRLQPLKDVLVKKSRLTLLLLLGAAGFVLMIACVNLTHLTLARALARRKEAGVRSALGASRFHLVRQILVECVLLAVFSGAAGLLVAAWSKSVLQAALPAEMPRFNVIEIDSLVVAFTVALSIVAALSFGLVTALSATKLDLVSLLKDGSASLTGHSRARLSDALLILQVALSFALLAGTGLMARTLARLLAVNPGFIPGQVLTLDVLLPLSKYAHPDQRLAYFDAVLQRLDSTPGVQSVAGIDYLPMGGVPYYFSPVTPPETPNLPDADLRNMAAVRTVTRDYFETLRVPLLRGRPFNRSDAPKSGKVAIISQSMGHRFWPGENPIGQRFRAILDVYEVVGEVADIRHDGLHLPSRLEFYLPYDQTPGPSMNLVIRTSRDAALSAAEIRRQVLSIDPNQPISDVRTMKSVVESSVAPQKSLMILLGTFSLLALLLAAVGCYGVMAYSVSQRVREMGLRMALGASPTSILQLVLQRGLALTFTGLLVGLLSALALTRLLTNLLFEVSPLDPATFFCAAAIILVVILLGSYVPARRASRVDPMVALRCE